MKRIFVYLLAITLVLPLASQPGNKTPQKPPKITRPVSKPKPTQKPAARPKPKPSPKPQPKPAPRPVNTKSYVDLGLPSGTYWATVNESGFFTFDRAVQQFGDKLPSDAQWKELTDYCEWQWTGSGYKVIGKNGKSMVLPAAGFRNCNGSVNFVGSWGYYWSSTPDGSDRAWSLYFDSDKVYMYSISRCIGCSVRLVN